MPSDLQVHFRGYPSNLLLPCEGEDSVKWSFINSLKEVSCVIASIYDGTHLIDNIYLFSVQLLKEYACALQHIHLLVLALVHL